MHKRCFYEWTLYSSSRRIDLWEEGRRRRRLGEEDEDDNDNDEDKDKDDAEDNDKNNILLLLLIILLPPPPSSSTVSPLSPKPLRQYQEPNSFFSSQTNKLPWPAFNVATKQISFHSSKTPVRHRCQKRNQFIQGVCYRLCDSKSIFIKLIVELGH